MTIIKKFKPEDLEKKSRKKPFVIIAACFLILVIAQIWVNNTVLGFGDRFESISKLKKALEMENQLLENEIADDSSLTNIATKGAELGFSRLESIQYIR